MINDRLIDAGELPLAVRDFGGDQQPLLLLHGAGGNLATMTTLARALRPHHRVITVDLRGHGRSGDGEWTWDAALADLAAVCVQMEVERPAIVGHELGGMLAMLWGQRHPEAPGVVSLDGNPAPTQVTQVPGLDPITAKGALARLGEVLDDRQAPAGRVIPADQLPDLVERQQMAARDMGANEKVWIEGFRRNLVHENGETSLRPSMAAAFAMRELTENLDLGPVYASLTCPAMVVLPTREAPAEEPFAELFEAYRSYLVAQAAESGKVRHVSLHDASGAMVIEQPTALAALITDFLAG